MDEEVIEHLIYVERIESARHVIDLYSDKILPAVPSATTSSDERHYFNVDLKYWEDIYEEIWIQREEICSTRYDFKQYLHSLKGHEKKQIEASYRQLINPRELEYQVKTASKHLKRIYKWIKAVEKLLKKAAHQKNLQTNQTSSKSECRNHLILPKLSLKHIDCRKQHKNGNQTNNKSIKHENSSIKLDANSVVIQKSTVMQNSVVKQNSSMRADSSENESMKFFMLNNVASEISFTFVEVSEMRILEEITDREIIIANGEIEYSQLMVVEPELNISKDFPIQNNKLTASHIRCSNDNLSADSGTKCESTIECEQSLTLINVEMEPTGKRQQFSDEEQGDFVNGIDLNRENKRNELQDNHSLAFGRFKTTRKKSEQEMFSQMERNYLDLKSIFETLLDKPIKEKDLDLPKRMVVEPPEEEDKDLRDLVVEPNFQQQNNISKQEFLEEKSDELLKKPHGPIREKQYNSSKTADKEIPYSVVEQKLRAIKTNVETWTKDWKEFDESTNTELHAKKRSESIVESNSSATIQQDSANNFRSPRKLFEFNSDSNKWDSKRFFISFISKFHFFQIFLNEICKITIFSKWGGSSDLVKSSVVKLTWLEINGKEYRKRFFLISLIEKWARRLYWFISKRKSRLQEKWRDEKTELRQKFREERMKGSKFKTAR